MQKLIFLWENFGPTHADRCDAVARAGYKTIGLEMYGTSGTYDWVPETRSSFEKVTLCHDHRSIGISLLYALVRFRLRFGRGTWFMCHYERPVILFFAMFLRLLGDRVMTMADSKYDDYPRKLWREICKRAFMIPYQGAIGASARSRDYLRLLGIPKHKIMGGYDTLSIERFRVLSMDQSDISFKDRYFICIARFVQKKNHETLVRSYALYRQLVANPRELHLFGSGPLEGNLRQLVNELAISDYVVFHGFAQTADIAKALARSFALLLPSQEEQFGLVVIEAQAMGVPVIVSNVCGAADELVRNGINGFTIEPSNSDGLAKGMARLDQDEPMWQRFRKGAFEYAPKGDVAVFVQSVTALAGK